MPTDSQRPPKGGRELIDEYFIENRTRLLDIASFLDRLDRAGDGEAGRDIIGAAIGSDAGTLVSSVLAFHV